MTAKAELKKVMKEIRDSLKAHKNLHRNIFKDKKLGRAEGGSLMAENRKKIHVLFAKEEELVRRLLDKPKKEKSSKAGK